MSERQRLREVMKTLKPTRLDGAGIVTMLVAVGLIVRYVHEKGAKDVWTPNVVVGLFSIAVTVMIVQRIVRAEDRRRLRPRRDRAMYWLGLGIRGLVSAVAFDYALAHLESFRPLPTDAMALFDAWLDEQSTEDSDRSKLERLELMLEEMHSFAGYAENTRMRDLDVLEPELVTAIDDFQQQVNMVTMLANSIKAGALSSDGADVELRSLVEAARSFSAAYRSCGGATSWLAVLESMRRGYAEMNRLLVEGFPDE